MNGRNDFDDMTPEEIGEWARKDWAEGLAASAGKPKPRISSVKRDDHPHWTAVTTLFPARPGERVLVDRGVAEPVRGTLGEVLPARGSDLLEVQVGDGTWLCAKADGTAWAPNEHGWARVDALAVPVRAHRREGTGRPEQWILRAASGTGT